MGLFEIFCEKQSAFHMMEEEKSTPYCQTQMFLFSNFFAQIWLKGILATEKKTSLKLKRWSESESSDRWHAIVANSKH